MKVVILAGGFGTRLGEYTHKIPKPMVEIGGKPILFHIMKHYAFYGYKDFIIALGYKSEFIKDYFLNFSNRQSDFTVNLDKGSITIHNKSQFDWNVTLVDTGLNTMTGGRIKRLKSYIQDKTFMVTYGDGLSDVNIKSLLKFHISHGKMVTMTGVRPSARFGEIKIKNNKVSSFKEKPRLQKGWISGGFFVIEKTFLDLIDDDSVMFEKEPMEKVVEMEGLMVHRHEGFWKCMDNKRDREILESLWIANKAPWDH
tara:strand:- start:483 stop:1247 length:765 start_codon:yes stop_codon:yes gene_type:complete